MQLSLQIALEVIDKIFRIWKIKLGTNYMCSAALTYNQTVKELGSSIKIR